MSAGRMGRISVALVLAGFLVMLALGGLMGPEPSLADTVPTPAAHNPSGDALYVPFWSAAAKTADVASSSHQLMRYELLDVQWVIDHGTTNTTTLKIQYSNDDTNWSDRPTLVSASAADGDGMVQVTNLGRYTRVYADVTNSETVTITVKAVAK
jgi:hypothetical protein